MPKQIKYEVVLLAAANAGMITAEGSGEITDEGLLADVSLANQLAFVALGQWQGTDNKIIRWSKRRLEEWRDGLGGADKDLTLGALVAASYQALVDLEATPYLSDEKREIINAIMPPVARCSDFLNEGEEVYTTATEVLQPLYDLMGFVA